MDEQHPASSPEVDEALRAWRRRAADRDRAKGAIAFGVFCGLFAVVTVVTQPSSAKSHVDDSPGYWIALATVFALIGAGLVVGGLRKLRSPGSDG